MKPCPRNRKQIAELALNSQEIQQEQERELRAHLDNCAGCRGYLEEISSVTRKLRVAEPDAETRPSSSFHRNLIEALAGAKHESTVERLWAEILTLWNWRLVLPTAAAAGILVAWMFTRPHPRIPEPSALAIRHITTPVAKPCPEPTFSNYEIAAHQSLDKLDELLTEQGNRNLEPSPSYTAAGLPRSNMAD